MIFLVSVLHYLPKFNLKGRKSRHKPIKKKLNHSQSSSGSDSGKRQSTEKKIGLLGVCLCIYRRTLFAWSFSGIGVPPES